MRHATALLFADDECPDDVIRGAASGSAKDDTHLAVLLFGPAPMMPISAFGGLPYGSIDLPERWTALMEAKYTALKARAAAVGDIVAAEMSTGDVRPLFCPISDLPDYAAQSARIADCAYFAQSLRETPDAFYAMLNGVLFHSPIGAMLNVLPGGPAPRKVMVAWDDSAVAARAVHLALPYLLSADEVTIACFDAPPMSDGHPYEPGAAISTWLSHHGCDVTIAQFPTGGRDIASCLLDRSREAGSNLIVMGAYGHSRTRQVIFGGTTRSMIEQTDMPVFLAH